MNRIIIFRLKSLISRSIMLMLLASFVLAGCSAPADIEKTSTPTELPPPEVYITEIPDIELDVRRFLDAWLVEDYASMYAMLTRASKTVIDEETFTQKYKNTADEVALSELDYKIHTAYALNTNQGQAQYNLTMTSAVIGQLPREHQMSLIMEDGEWKVEWNETLILPELAGGNYLRMDWDIPVRAGIYDRNNNPLAEQTEAVAIGLYPDFVDLEDDNGLISLLSSLTNYASHTIIALALESEPGTYLALGEIPADKDPRRLELLRTYGAAVTQDYTSRIYYGGGVAPHITGFVSPIQEQEAEEFRRLGYRGDERIGRKELEAWGDEMLSGVHGGTLFVFSPDGKLVGQLGSTTSQPGKDIITTIDRDFQYRAQKAMSTFTGAAVVLERDTGRVLALVSTPGFNQNAFEIENFNWNTLLNDIVNNPNSPQFNRATEGQYPLGSVFKIITLAAAMEQGDYTVDSTYQCEYVFDELDGFPRYDWTYDHFQEDGTTQPSGLLTLPEGLIRSCNPYFWHIGLDLYNRGLTTAISEMSKGFGLGSNTGIEGMVEEPGRIPEPESQVDAINLAIGQGDMLVTPIQVARFVAAVGNGGTLFRPQVIESIQPAFGDPDFVFEPDPQSTLPISDSTLNVLQEAMIGVVRSRQPAGTAYSAFNGLDINVAGKTGSATTGASESHAWFAGYTFEERENLPDIAIVVIAESAGEGSEIAAPIFRRIVEEYFYGAPRKKYRWEATIDVTKSPTFPITETPTEQPR